MKKNVVIMMCDQLRKDCLGTYDNTHIHTPHIDQLAQEGTKYQRCYVNNPVCMPSRMTIFTGMYPRNHGLWANGVLLQDTKQTIMHHLGMNGWETASIGKIHLEPTQDQSGLKSREARCLWENINHTMEDNYWGFQYTRLTLGHGNVVGDYLKWFYENGGTDSERGINLIGSSTGKSKTPEKLHYSTYIGEAACDYITDKRDKSKPFFLCVSFPDPHIPFAPAKELGKQRVVKRPIGDEHDLVGRPSNYQAYYTQGLEDDKGVREKLSNEELQKIRIGYTYDMIELVDDNIGKIIQTLKSEGIYEETILVFVADHGELLGDHGLWRKGNALYEGLINIPLIVVDHQVKDQVSEELVSTIDIVPTLCDLLDVETPHYVDGKSLYGSDRAQYSLVEYRPMSNTCVYALISDQFKYIRYQNGEHELTDLKNDPQERRNVVEEARYQDVVKEMKEALLNQLIQNYSNKESKQFIY